MCPVQGLCRVSSKDTTLPTLVLFSSGRPELFVSSYPEYVGPFSVVVKSDPLRYYGFLLVIQPFFRKKISSVEGTNGDSVDSVEHSKRFETKGLNMSPLIAERTDGDTNGISKLARKRPKLSPIYFQ